MSSSCREVEHRSASACSYESGTVAIQNDGWKLATDENDFATLGITKDNMAEYAAGNTDTIIIDGDDINGTKLVKVQMLSSGTTIRVPPMERASGGWSSDNFHEHLRLPIDSKPGKGMVIQLQAMGRECLAVALSPYHSYELGKTYVVHFGANGNLQTVLRRHVNYSECVDVTFPSRVCSEEKWISYWIILQGGKLSAGVGNCPGKNCIGVLDDSMYDMLRSGVDAVRYIGIGNSALQKNAKDARVRNVVVMGIPSHFGLEGIPIEEGGKMINILELGYGAQSSGGGDMPTEADLLAEYEKERTKAKARAAKFGIEYKEPAPDAFLKWSEARRLRANPERGFITGIDTFSNEEKAKATARKDRFAKEERKRKGFDEDEIDDDDDNGEDGEEAMDDEEDNVAEWEKAKKDPLPIEQAWENWKLVKRFRVDPPPGLLTSGDGETEVVVDCPTDEMEGETKEFIPKKVSVVATKIHIFSLDWAPFKQIRTDDLMAYFKDYGPSYVEWLGELSCNVMFEDRHSAARAFHAMSRELPSPPPESATKKLDWVPPESIKPPEWMTKSKEGDVADDNVDGADGDEGNAIMDETTSDNKDIGAPKDDKQEEDILPNYGGMGWRFCKWTVRKVSNDYYGRRGTQARVLMRLATSNDVLDDRPTEWPKPPKGFTTKRVLLPWHDFSGKRKGGKGQRDNKKRRRGSGQRRSGGRGRRNDNDDYMDMGGEHPLLSQGLKSGRSGGFSVDELEAERKAKNAVILDIES